MLVIDPKVHRTQEDRDKIVQQIKDTGLYDGPGVWMNKAASVKDDYLPLEEKLPEGFSKWTPNPDAKRVEIELHEKVTLPMQWGKYTIEPNGSLIVRERDIPSVRAALEEYEKTGNPRSILQDDGKAVYDAYGTDPFFVADNYNYVPVQGAAHRAVLERIINEGQRMANPYVQGSPDVILAVQLKEGEHITIPYNGGAGKLVESPDWIAVNEKDVPKIRESLDLDTPLMLPDGPLHPLRVLDDDTIQKSFESLPAGGLSTKTRNAPAVSRRISEGVPQVG